MRLAFLFLLAALEIGAQVPDEVPRQRDPETPSKQALDALNPSPVSEVEVEMIFDENKVGLNHYSQESMPFSGWLYQEFPEDSHRHRYLLVENGVVTWQIGYYENGRLDFDFHVWREKGWGSHRMWYEDGSPYINYYYSKPGVKDGLQRRWNGKGELVLKLLYDNGELVSEE